MGFYFNGYILSLRLLLKNRILPEEAPKVSPRGERLKGVTLQA